ncbi:MAG: guanylate kinase [Bacilli bacterium]|nr:guanylate kinase [Bacilli bacterium]
MEKKGRLIILSGPSGVGKGTIREQLFNNKELNLAYSISMTTRKPRVNEVNGVDYFFVSEKEFLRSIDNDELIEWAEFVGNYYGTPKYYVEELLKKGKNVVLEIEVQGATQVIASCKDVLSIFIVPPSMEELERRIRSRQTETEAVIKTRLAKAASEIDTADNYDYVVENTNVANAVLEISKIIKENTN